MDMKHVKVNLNDHQESFPIAIVVSQFNHEITQKLQYGAIERLIACGFTKDDITLVEVPGAVEIPFTAQQLAKQSRYAAIIALGAVIRGETTHYDYVCQVVSNGCQRVSLDFNLPVIFGVLTTEDEAQALARVGGSHGHKGADAADCALAMVAIFKQLK
jgi:6,7-dimethyl-8-ribityllumazine synthase